MKLRILILLSLFSSSLLAQIDSTYIGAYNQRLSLKTYFGYDLLSMIYQEEGEKDISYMPNTPPYLGIGASINRTVISVSYGYGFNFMRDKERGKTKAFDFQLHNYGRKFVIDLYVQKYSGFYQDDEDDKKDKEIILAPDLRINQYGASAQYVFNHKKFSYTAAFDQNEKQLKSAGSFLFGTGAYITKIASDSSFVHNGKNVLRNFQFGFSGGYAYTWVINKKWYVNGSIVMGVNLGSEKASEFGNKKLEFYPTVLPRISAGYSRKDWSLGFIYVGNMLFPAFSSKSNIGLLSSTVRMSYTHRIESVPILSKIFD